MNEKELNVYKYKIEVIMDNRFAYGIDNEEQVEIIQHWLACEWQCNEWMSMDDYRELSIYLVELAEEKIISL